MAEFKIMVVEDDPAIRALETEALVRWGFRVASPDPSLDLVAELVREAPHLVILDVGLPRLDGYEWCERMRAVSRAPILFVSARSGSADAVRGLVSGGDDWLSKPFDADLLVAKARALLRRAYAWAPDGSAPLERDGLVLDRERCEASRGGHRVKLTGHEAILLARLMERDGRVVSRDDLMEALWSGEAFVDENTLNVNVARLRRALGSIGAGEVVETVRGLGYRMR